MKKIKPLFIGGILIGIGLGIFGYILDTTPKFFIGFPLFLLLVGSGIYTLITINYERR